MLENINARTRIVLVVLASALPMLALAFAGLVLVRYGAVSYYYAVSPRESHSSFAVKKLLVETELSISEIGFRIGFEDPGYFCRAFKKWVGLKATVFRMEYRQMGRAQPRPPT